jgi:hypothetical protein
LALATARHHDDVILLLLSAAEFLHGSDNGVEQCRSWEVCMHAETIEQAGLAELLILGVPGFGHSVGV